MKKLFPISATQIIPVPKFANDSGYLAVYDRDNGIPFDIARVFVVRADGGQQRGRHAHRQCAQFLVCLHGACDVVCDDGVERVSFHLDGPKQGLFLPPSIWAHQNYLQDDTLLMVLCDHLYDEEDYFRQYGDFLSWRTS